MRRFPLLTVATALMLAGTLAVSLSAGDRAPEPLKRPLDQIPANIQGWEGSQGPNPTDRELELLAATSYLSRTYRKQGRALDLWIAYYALQRAGESMHTPKNCLPAAGWEISNYDSARIPLDGRMEKINKFTVQNGENKVLVLYWYQTGDRVISNEYKGKIFLLWDAITKRRTNGSIVRITLPDTPQAARDGLSFAAAIMAQMRTAFRG
jgi:EpsI family protein